MSVLGETLAKVAVAQGRLRISQSRKGRRPLSVDTFLKKEKDGSLYKEAEPQFSGVAEAKKHLQPGDILLTRAVNPTFMSRLVSAVQGSEYGHSAVYAGKGKVIDTRVGAGVFETTLDEVHKEWGGGRDIRVLRPRVSDEAREEAVRIARSHIGTPYSLTAAARLIFPAAKNEEAVIPKRDSIICSQLVTRSFPTLNVAPTKFRDHVLPIDFDKSKLTKRVGTLLFKKDDKMKTAQAVLDEYLSEHPDYFKEALAPAPAPAAAPGKFENKLPWYTTAAGGAGGAMLGQKLLKKSPALGAMAGVLAGTGLGLEGGTVIGRKLDKHASSMTPIMANFAEGGARGIDSTVTIIDDDERGKPAKSKTRKGDAPSRDSVNNLNPSIESSPGLRSLDTAMKVAKVMGRLVDQGERAPSREDMSKVDPVAQFSRTVSNYQHSSDQAVPGFNPNDNSKTAGAEEPYRLTIPELLKFCSAYSEAVQAFSSEKLASAELEELHKEALLSALSKVIPKSKKLIQLGGETIDLRPKSGLSYSGIGKKLESYGSMFRLPQGVTRAESAAAGSTKGVGSRIFGEGLHSAGHHMAHTGVVGKAMNPLGKPVGGFIEGISRGAGQELQHAGGAVATGVKGPATTLGGGFRGQIGRGLEKAAPRIGQAGEIATAAGTATALGHAVSPAAHGLAALAKTTGVYAPAKAHLGSLGFNLAKDVAATGVESAASAAPKAVGAVRSALPMAGRLIGRAGASAV